MAMHEESLLHEPVTWVVIAFFVFFILFGKKLYSALTDILDQRAAAVRTELAEAKRLRQEAEAMLRDATSRRASAIADAQALLQGAKAEAARLAGAAAAEAEAAATRRERMAIERIAAAEKAAVEEMRMTAADVAATAAERVIREGLSEASDAALIDRAIGELPAALASKRAA
jgi:F-type H+-transporting ATPase subunit b